MGQVSCEDRFVRQWRKGTHARENSWDLATTIREIVATKSIMSVDLVWWSIVDHDLLSLNALEWLRTHNFQTPVGNILTDVWCVEDGGQVQRWVSFVYERANGEQPEYRWMLFR